MGRCRNLKAAEAGAIAEAFTGRYRLRNLALWATGCNTGFRISELLSITIGDVVNKFGEIPEYLTVQRRNMKKKKQSRTVRINKVLRGILREWIIELYNRGYMHKDTPIFCKSNGKAISRIEAWRIIKDAQDKCNISGTVATHSMRKTFGMNAHDRLLERLKKGEKIDVLLETMNILGHTDPRSTIRYLEVNQELKEQVTEEVALGFDWLRPSPGF